MAATTAGFLREESDLLTDDYDEEDYIESNYIGKFTASEIAALIGKHEYRSIAQALYKCLLKNEKFAQAIESVKRETNNRNDKIVNNYVYRVSQDVKKIIEEVSVENTTVCNIDSYVDEQIANAMANLNINENEEIVKRVQKELRSRVNMGRGTKLEQLALDQVEFEYGIKISERNSKLYKYECEEFKLSGKIDGFDEDGECVIEIKNRVKQIVEVPHYDMIQCIVYMKLTNAEKCLLVERFPDKTIRQTLLVWNDDEYMDIHEQLCNLVKKVRKMTRIEIAELIRSYDADCAA